MFKRVTGTRDILPDQVAWWQKIEEISRTIFSLYNYKEIRPPLVEEAGLFNRSLGEATEIVQKQMFLIQREEESYALRPEGTASIVRAYIENNLDKTAAFQKLYYIGPMFRMERPQKGRQRQFHHIGCEAIGSKEPGIDVEVIALADALLKGFGISGYRTVINSLGCPQDRKRLGALIREKLAQKLSGLCEECKVRYERNTLRILDCKNEPCREAVKSLELNDFLCEPCRSHFTRVREGLDCLKIAYEVSPNLVRGLDYYTGTVFEFKHEGLGPQQDALGAGGRYDTLVKELGGPELGAIGFAFGVERLLLASGEQMRESAAACQVYLITLGEQARQAGIPLLAELRSAGISADTDYENKSLKASMRRANDLGCLTVLILGDDELKENCVMIKDMAKGGQEKLPLGQLTAHLKNQRS